MVTVPLSASENTQLNNEAHQRAYLHASQANNGIIPWCMTWRVDTLSVFFLAMKKKVSKNSVNFEM